MSTYKGLMSSLLTIVVLAFSGCSNDSEPRNAQFLTLSELRVTPGFEWFDQQYNNYKPDTNIINQIKAELLKEKTDEFILYVNPSCACTGTQEQFPAAVKILHESGIFEPRFIIYSMYSEGDNHPDMAVYKVLDLPSFYSKRDTNPVYSVIDSLTHYMNFVPQTEWLIEEFVLRAISI